MGVILTANTIALMAHVSVKSRGNLFLPAAKPTGLGETDFLLLSFFFLKRCKKSFKTAKSVQTNMVAYVVWAINFKSEVRSDLQGCLEATVASKHHILHLMEVLNLLTTNSWAPIDGRS